jgi:hypothetical protein
MISVQEAHFFADAVVFDRYGNGQKPQYNFGIRVPTQLFV